MRKWLLTAIVVVIASSAHADVKKDIIERCRAQVGNYGSAMVKACVDQDVQAFNALAKYPNESTSITERCKRQMMRYGWNMVKACADQDIEAEKALSDY